MYPEFELAQRAAPLRLSSAYGVHTTSTAASVCVPGCNSGRCCRLLPCGKRPNGVSGIEGCRNLRRLSCSVSYTQLNPWPDPRPQLRRLSLPMTTLPPLTAADPTNVDLSTPKTAENDPSDWCGQPGPVSRAPCTAAVRTGTTCASKAVQGAALSICRGGCAAVCG